MKTKSSSLRRATGIVALGTSVLFITASPVIASDIPDQQPSAPRLAGMYKVTSSNDPVFPMGDKQEWFLDFGQGMSGGKLSGSVAVSLRQNPNVKVRIMAWQYFPKQGVFVIGNPYAEGARQAVAKGSWTMNSGSGGVVLGRGSYQLVMNRAAAADY